MGLILATLATVDEEDGEYVNIVEEGRRLALQLPRIRLVPGAVARV